MPFVCFWQLFTSAAQYVWAVQALGRLYHLHGPDSVPLRHEATSANCISDVVTINYYRRNPMTPF